MAWLVCLCPLAPRSVRKSLFAREMEIQTYPCRCHSKDLYNSACSDAIRYCVSQLNILKERFIGPPPTMNQVCLSSMWTGRFRAGNNTCYARQNLSSLLCWVALHFFGTWRHQKTNQSTTALVGRLCNHSAVQQHNRDTTGLFDLYSSRFVV